MHTVHHETLDLIQLQDAAVHAARQAGAVILELKESYTPGRKKSGGTSPASQIVTDADLRSQACIVECLKPCMAEYKLGLLAEEATDDTSRFEKDYFWCVDPLDGTLCFSEGAPGYAVSIALVSKAGIPLIAVVLDPSDYTLYTAVRGGGVYRNGKKMLSSPASGSPGMLSVIVDYGYTPSPAYEQCLKALKQAALSSGYTGMEIIRHGGAVLNACRVLELADACYFKLPKSEAGGGSLWDYAATTLLVQERGCVAGDIYAEPLELNRPDSTFLNHRGVLFAGTRDLAALIGEVLAASFNPDRQYRF
jgi:myo-inositol-1(or 4)-monophosphatase